MRYQAIVMAVAIAGLAACGGGSTSPTSSLAPATVTPAMLSTLARERDPRVPDADIATAVADNTTFALKALKQLDEAGNQNTVFSPYSITQAVAMLGLGANGNTLGGIRQALSLSLSPTQLAPALNAIDLRLAAETSGAATNGAGSSPSLSIVNDVWTQDGFAILPRYLDALALNFGAGVRPLDFVGAADDARKTINSYIARQTNNRIPDLMPAGSISADTRLVLTNAVWFKAKWQSPFPSANSQTRPFIGYTAGVSAVPFMSQRTTLEYAQSGDYQAVSLPYSGGALSMLIIMPPPGTFNTFLSGLTAAKLDEIARNLSAQPVALSLPKFRVDTSARLGPALKALGMIDAFSPANADLSGIDGRRDLFVSAAEHKAYLSVDEDGTEAAAATGLGVSTTAIAVPTPAVPFNVDHPFLFMLQERNTGLVLFLGKVVSL